MLELSPYEKITNFTSGNYSVTGFWIVLERKMTSHLLQMIMPSGTIHILRPHNFGLFLTHPSTLHKYSTERQQNCQFSRPTHPDVIYGWSLTAMFVIVSWISFLMPLDRGAFNNYVDQTLPNF